MALVIRGRLVPLQRDDPSAVFKGSVYIDDDGRIEAVAPSRRKALAGYEHAPVVEGGDALVFPGLIDLHNHLAYNTLGLWTDETRAEPFVDHTTWPRRKSYAPDITWPAYAFIMAAPEELLAFAEIKAIIGGTTSIQGSPPKNRPRDGTLVRNIEDETWGVKGGANVIYASALTAKAPDLQDRANKMRDGSLFIYHCAEGQRGSAVAAEYTSARQAGCLQNHFIAIHCNSIDPGGFGQWKTTGRGAAKAKGAVVWSPFSNTWLYGRGATTAIDRVLNNDITLCIGSDWAPSGTKHVLGEVKVARIVAKDLGVDLADEELVAAVTCNPGDVLERGWARQVGRLEPEAVGDVVVIDASGEVSPWKTLVAAVERDVQLVVIDGKPGYGTKTLMQQASAPLTTPLTVDGTQRLLSLARPDDPGRAWSFADITARLEQVRANPKQEIERGQARAARFDGELDEPDAPLRLALDMPTGIAPIGGLPKDLGTIVIPPLQSLTHDDDWFAAVRKNPYHEGLLDQLQTFYN
jgi:5-methylthioadenosine/S-adenosylhomocysteine deaminase